MRGFFVGGRGESGAGKLKPTLRDCRRQLAAMLLGTLIASSCRGVRMRGFFVGAVGESDAGGLKPTLRDCRRQLAAMLLGTLIRALAGACACGAFSLGPWGGRTLVG